MRVEDFLRSSAARSPGKVALVAGKERLTFRDIDVASDRLAATLAAHGVARGDRVVVFMDNCAEAVVAIFAALKAGAIFSPVNASTKADKLAYILNNSEAAALVTQHRLLGVAADALADAPSVRLTIAAGGQEAPALPGAMHWRDALAAEPHAAARGRHRYRPRHDHLHVGLDRLAEGRDDDASQHRRRRRLDHLLSWEPTPTTSS